MLNYDPYDPDLLVHGVPFDQLARIRAEQPVCPTPTEAWYVSRRSDVERVLKDVDTFQADLGPITGLSGLEDVPPEQLYLSEILEPRHGQVRRLYNACFGPHRTRMVDTVTADICHELVDGLLAAEVPDLHAGYAMPIPGRVMAHVMGLAPEASDNFLRWSADETLMTRPCTPGVEPGGPPIFAFFAEELARQKALPEPTNRVFQVLLDAEVDGAPLTDTEIVTQLHFMVMAGVHTTRGLLTHVVQRLLHEPALFERLRSEPDLIPVYVEESLRHDAPVQRTTRRVRRDTEVHGVAMLPGQWVEVGIASANRDEDVYDDGESFRLDRPEPRDHLAFGAGSHVCPGATLARLEAVTAVEVLLERVESMAEVAGVRYPPMPGNLGGTPIPAVLTPRRAATGEA